MLRLAVAAFVLLAFAGCAGADQSSSPVVTSAATPPGATPLGASPLETDTPVPPTREPTAVATIPASPPVIGVPQDVLAFVRERAANDLGVNPEDIEFERTEPVTWTTTAIGCPEPGRSYAQVLIPGYLIVVRGGDQTLNVHMSTEGQVKLCPEGQQELPS